MKPSRKNPENGDLRLPEHPSGDLSAESEPVAHDREDTIVAPQADVEAGESGEDEIEEGSDFDTPSETPRAHTGAGEALTGKSRRGVVGEQWWAHRWCDLLAESGRSERLHRGRVLARTGNVFGFRIEVGSMHGEVRQSRAELHESNLELAPWSPDELSRVLTEVARRARYGAALLAGTLDPRLEEALLEIGMHLFPRNFAELTSSCTCAEEVQPCPHVAALIYMFAERIDRNPFLLLRLRGIRREALLEECRRRRSPSEESTEKIESESVHDEEIDRTDGRSRAVYFGDEHAILEIDPRSTGDETHTTILEELGLPPRVEDETFSALAVTDAYQHIQAAVDRLLGDESD